MTVLYEMCQIKWQLVTLHSTILMAAALPSQLRFKCSYNKNMCIFWGNTTFLNNMCTFDWIYITCWSFISAYAAFYFKIFKHLTIKRVLIFPFWNNTLIPDLLKFYPQRWKEISSQIFIFITNFPNFYKNHLSNDFLVRTLFQEIIQKMIFINVRKVSYENKNFGHCMKLISW